MKPDGPLDYICELRRYVSCDFWHDLPTVADRFACLAAQGGDNSMVHRSMERIPTHFSLLPLLLGGSLRLTSRENITSGPQMGALAV